jgi:L-alanine-DL-glutamate epimerase-like enolase superfamily enzyme
VAVVTEVFANLARTAAAAKGFRDLRMHVLPHPMESRTESDVRAIARARFRDIVRLLVERA